MIRVMLHELLKGRRDLKILDYGCGWGATLLSLPKRHIQSFAYDICEEAVSSLATVMGFMGRPFRRADVETDGAIKPGGFDLVICSHVLEHVDDDVELLGQFVNAIRPGGGILINVPINEVWQDPKHVRRYDRAVLSEKMTRLGLKIAACVEADRWSAFLISHEMVDGEKRFDKKWCRGLRLALAIMPASFVAVAERALGPKWQPQQLLILGVK